MTENALENQRQQYINWLRENWHQQDAAHDLQHLHRVWRNCKLIMKGEKDAADPVILLAAAYFHDLISYPKNHPQRSLSSLHSADEAITILRTLGFPEDKFYEVHHAILAHSFSAGVETATIEARILQDADRLEALGAMGIARLFYTAGQMNTLLYNPGDPAGKKRQLDDKMFAIDHFEIKLLKLPAIMKTETGKYLAENEAAYVMNFRDKILEEITQANG